jgi:AraC family transcriptional regulator of adaptative response/methylated-DNA-[protein]-cysteine methyltransferase
MKTSYNILISGRVRSSPEDELYAVVTTDIGNVLIVAGDRGVSRIELLETDSPSAPMRDNLEAFFLDRQTTHKTVKTGRAMSAQKFRALISAVVDAFNDLGTKSRVPQRIVGTPFQLAVWRFLQSIPVGSALTYAEIACAIGSPRAYRAVANACGANRIAILIPCHRAIRSDGSLGGYRWGIKRKQLLLERERSASCGLNDAALASPADNLEDQQSL